MSLTDRCNLRCTYCMPAEGLDWLPREQLLSFDELIRLITGGHQARNRRRSFHRWRTAAVPAAQDIISATARLHPRPGIALTTNGIGLAQRAKSLAEAGLDRVNVSLDTLRADRFSTITRRDRLDAVIDGLPRQRGGSAAGEGECRSRPATGLEDAIELLTFCMEYGYQLRIIEQMPLDAGHLWSRDFILSADTIPSKSCPRHSI